MVIIVALEKLYSSLKLTVLNKVVLNASLKMKTKQNKLTAPYNGK